MNVQVEALPTLPARNADGHKGTYGRVLLVGGSLGMAGSISLSGMAALRSGAGLTTVATPAATLATVAAFEPCYMTIPLSHDSDGRVDRQAATKVLDLQHKFDVFALGPGLGQSDDVFAFVDELYREVTKPMVVDADGLNALAQSPHPPSSPAPRILTPHPGEMARLLKAAGMPTEALCEDEGRREAAAKYAAIFKVVVVLKGHRTVIADGKRLAINATGNPGMATGGTGDLLTGVITALVAQGLPPFEAAQLAVHAHGRAGDLAAAKIGLTGMVARDLLGYLPLALTEATA